MGHTHARPGTRHIVGPTVPCSHTVQCLHSYLQLPNPLHYATWSQCTLVPLNCCWMALFEHTEHTRHIMITAVCAASVCGSGLHHFPAHSMTVTGCQKQLLLQGLFSVHAAPFVQTHLVLMLCLSKLLTGRFISSYCTLQSNIDEDT